MSLSAPRLRTACLRAACLRAACLRTARKQALLRTHRSGLLALSAIAVVAVLSLLSGTRFSTSNAADMTSTTPRFVFREFGIHADTLWLASAEDPASRTRIAAVPHAPEWGSFVSLSPDSRWIAYTAISPQAANVSATTPAELWVIGTDGRDRRRLATGVDLRVTPLWSPDGREVIVRRTSVVADGLPTYELLAFDLQGRSRSVLRQAESAVLPVGFTPDAAALYFVQLSQGGTDLGRIDVSGSRLIGHLSDDLTRDWRLSPDGRQIAFLAPEIAQGRLRLKAQISQLDGTPLPVAGPEGNHFSPIWYPDGRGFTIGTPGAAVNIDLSTEEVRPVSTASWPGLAVPAAWSADAAFLALHHFLPARSLPARGLPTSGLPTRGLPTRGAQAGAQAGENALPDLPAQAGQPVRRRLVISNRAGNRVDVATGAGETEFVGWMGK